MSITLEDVEIAIKILRKFIEQYQQAQMIFRRLGTLSGVSRFRGSRPEDFIKMAFEMTQRQKTGEVEIEEELTEEELERIREIKEKIEKSEAKPIS